MCSFQMSLSCYNIIVMYFSRNHNHSLNSCVSLIHSYPMATETNTWICTYSQSHCPVFLLRTWNWGSTLQSGQYHLALPLGSLSICKQVMWNHSIVHLGLSHAIPWLSHAIITCNTLRVQYPVLSISGLVFPWIISPIISKRLFWTSGDT